LGFTRLVWRVLPGSIGSTGSATVLADFSLNLAHFTLFTYPMLTG
jgi:hypothetical protein